MSPRIVDKDEKRAALVEAAAAVFARQGFQATTMADIAHEAGVAKGSLYLYFDTKDDLFYAVFEWFRMKTRASVVAALDSSGSAGERLKACAHAAVAAVNEHREWYALTLEIWAASAAQSARHCWADALQAMYADYRAPLAALIRKGQADGEFTPDNDPDALASALTGAMDGILLQCWFDPALQPHELVEAFVNTLLAGMCDVQQGQAGGLNNESRDHS